MRKTEEWQDYFLEVMSMRYEETKEKIEKRYQKEKNKIQKSFFEVVITLLQKGITAQKNNQKKEIAYLTFFQLNSSIQRKSYEIQIGLYEKMFYYDKREIYALWYPEFLIEDIEKDREYFQKKARQEVYQIRYLQLEEARQEYEAAVFVLFYKYLIEWIPELLKRKELEELEKIEEFEITYGAYMGEQYCLYKRKEEKKLSR